MLILRKPQTVAFFVLAFDISWTLWTPAALADSPALVLLVFLGAFGRSLAAILLTGVGEGRSGLKVLLGRLFAWASASGGTW